MARGCAEPWEALPKKAGGLFTKLASSVATRPDSNYTHAHRCARESANTEHATHTAKQDVCKHTCTCR